MSHQNRDKNGYLADVSNFIGWLVCATCRTMTPLALEMCRNSENVHYFLGNIRVIGEFETFTGRSRLRQC